MKVERLSTGCEPIDKLLNGGLEKGLITNVFGESGSGKTNFCVQVAAEVAANGGKVVYMDTEKGFSPERFEQIAGHEPLENMVVTEPKTFEEQESDFSSIEQLVENEKPELVIVDSMVSLYRLNVNGDNASEMNQKLSKQLSTLSKVARTHNIPILITNQVYTSFEGDELELVGRDVPRYWSKCLIELQYVKQGIRKAKIEKHRSLPEGKSRRFKITNDGLVEPDEKGLF